MRRREEVLMIFFLFLTLMPAAHAIGIAPASSEHHSMIDNTLQFRFKVLNPDGEQIGATLSAEGELAQYITFSEQAVQFKKGETEHWVTAELNVSEELKPSLYESRIIVTNAPTGTGTFSATLQVVHRLSLFVDYPDFFVKADVLVPDFEVGKEDIFELYVRNKGMYDVDADLDAWVRIPGTSKAQRLRSPDVSLAVGQHSTIDLAWTPKWPGDYVFNAEIAYADTSTTLSEPFMVGTPLLTPEWAEIRPVPLGEVLPITLGITSNWNVPIKAVHAWVELWQNDKLLLQTGTVSEDIAPRGEVELPIYIETADLEYGTYIIEMDLVSGRTRADYTFELTLSPEDITLTPTGFLITVKEETLLKRLGRPLALIALVTVLLAVVVFGYVMKRKKDQD